MTAVMRPTFSFSEVETEIIKQPLNINIDVFSNTFLCSDLIFFNSCFNLSCHLRTLEAVVFLQSCSNSDPFFDGNWAVKSVKIGNSKNK